MGRNIPLSNETPSHYHLLSLTLLLACMAAVVAMCGTRFRKKHKSKEKDDNNEDNITWPPPQDKLETLGSTPKTPPPPPATTTTTTTTIIGEGEEVNKPLPPPPSAIAIDRVPLDHKKKPNIDKSSSLHNYMSSKTSRRRLSTGSINLRIPTGCSVKRKERGVQEQVHKTMRSKQEESLWSKKILLGEKCRLHEEDEEEAGVSYGVNEKGKLVCSLNSVPDENDGEALSMSDSSVGEDSSSSLEEEMLKEKESERSSDVVLEQV